MTTYEVTLAGFDGTSDTDHLVKWIKAPGEGDVRVFLHRLGLRAESIVPLEAAMGDLDHTDGVDVILDAFSKPRSLVGFNYH